MPEPRPDSAGVKLPPPMTFAAPLVLGLVAGRWWCPLPAPPAWGSRVVGGILFVAGLAFGGWARLLFVRRKTTVLPFRPSSVLVADGPFRFSRNPIYVAFTAIYVGISLLFRSLWPLILLPLVLIVLQKTAIDREEAYLERRFGDEYREYRKRVRRWL